MSFPLIIDNIKIKEAITNILKKEFVKATFSGKNRGHSRHWNKVIIAPVRIKKKVYLQFVYYDDFKASTKNIAYNEAEETVLNIISMAFSSIYIRNNDNSIHIQITKKGKVLSKQSKNLPIARTNLNHDKTKKRMITPDNSNRFLEEIGLSDVKGNIKPKMQSKYKQINEFLRIFEKTNFFAKQKRKEETIKIIDCGTGNAYLTFSIYNYLTTLQSLPTEIVGVDITPQVIENNNLKVRNLGWNRIRFEISNIIGFTPNWKPDIVLALHACDTATDEAIAKAIKWDAEQIFVIPCCHHHLQKQLSSGKKIELFQPILSHGILRERLGDVLTDSFRSLILELLGYSTSVMQFVSTEHTGKNILIRAIKNKNAKPSRLLFEKYKKLCEFWKIEPYLSSLLTKELQEFKFSIGQ